MSRARWIASFLILAAVSHGGWKVAVSSGETLPTLEQLIRANTYKLDHADGLGGPGFGFLMNEIADSGFVVLGEPHNVAEVDWFTSMLFDSLRQRLGFRYLALEQGPFLMDRLASAAVRDSLRGVVNEAVRDPDALHFYTDQELSLYAHVATVAGPGSMWGLDRTLSAVSVIEAAATAVVDENLRGQWKKLAEEARAYNAAHRLEGKRLLTSEPARFEHLGEGLDAALPEEARDRLDWLRARRGTSSFRPEPTRVEKRATGPISTGRN